MPASDKPAQAVSPAPLYRRAAVAARAGQRFGSVMPAGLPGLRAAGVAALLVFCAIAALLQYGSYAARESVRGVVTTAAANVVIRSRRGGLVSAVPVSEGMRVGKGAYLAHLQQAQTAAGVSIDDALIASLHRELRGLEQELEQARQLHEANLRRLAAEADGAQAEVLLLEEEVAGAGRRVELGKDRHARLVGLAARGLVARAEVQQSEARNLVLDGEHAALRRRLLQARQRVAAIAREHSGLPAQFAVRNAARARETERTRQRLIAESAARDEAVTAPLDGRVSGIRVRPGDTVAAGEALMTLLPLSSRPEVTLQVPDRAIASVRPGMPVRLRVDAFPYVTFGLLRGEVIDVSEAPVALQDGQPRHYTARVALQRDHPGIVLQPGMGVTADVMRERRRLLDWLLDPLRAGGGRL